MEESLGVPLPAHRRIVAYLERWRPAAAKSFAENFTPLAHTLDILRNACVTVLNAAGRAFAFLLRSRGKQPPSFVRFDIALKRFT